MDYENARDEGNGIALGGAAPEIAAAAPADTAPARPGAVVIQPDANNVVTLPAGVALDDIKVQGRDLVIELPDGRTMVIADGTVFVPVIAIDGVTVPPLNLAAYLNGDTPQPAAGTVTSSGGNFADPTAPIQAAFGLGDLLPYTELNFPAAPQEEVIPNPIDEDPTTIIITPDQPAGATAATSSVSEAGLPARGNESAGSNSAANSETTAGSIVFETPDGFGSLSINGTVITQVGQTVTTAQGTLTITSIAAGNVGYSYTLTDNTLGNNTSENFTVVVTDADGDAASATLTINIADDTPTANDDAATILEGDADNAITFDVDLNDVSGADSTASRTFASLTGTYGNLTLNADGTQTYTLNALGVTTINGLRPGQTLTDSFTYTLTDGDGDSDPAQLVITLQGTNDLPIITNLTPAAQGGDATVDEDDLPAGSDTTKESLTATGSFNISAQDGVGNLTVGGIAVIVNGQFQAGASATTPLGNTLTFTGYNAATGQISYSYTLTGNEGHAEGQGQNSLFENFAVSLTDADGDTATDTLVVNIVDDVATANADINGVAEGGSVGGNVLTNDVFGADGAGTTTPVGGIVGVRLAAGDFTTAASGGLGTTIEGQFGRLTLTADGKYSYAANPNSTSTGAQDVFVYTIKDGDGDLSTTTLTIRVSDVTANISDNDVLVDESGLEGGSQIAPDGEFFTGGQITVAGASGTLTYTLLSPANGLYGTLTLNGATGAYSYVLDTPYDGATANNDRNVVSGAESFSYQVSDQNGNILGGGSIQVDIRDDVPTARADTNSVAEGGTVTTEGNGVLVNDTPGADGFGSPAVVGVAAGTSTASPVSGGVGIEILGTYGKLTLNADGSYTYKGTPGAVPSGVVTDSFVYTIQDGDGDLSTTTLKIDVRNVDLKPDNQTVEVNEAALDTSVTPPDLGAGTVTGSVGLGSAAETVTGKLAVVGDGITYVVQSNVATTYGLFDLKADGSYTYTLTKTVDSGATQGANTVLAAETISYVAQDPGGTTVTGTITINVVDDVPTATADTGSVVEGATLTVTVDVGVLANDVAGADGYAAGGGVVGVIAGSDTKAAVSGNVGTSIDGLYGTLTLQADGSYTYAAFADKITTGVTDSFVYTIKDGDGDLSTTTLKIDVADVSLPPDNRTVTVNEAALDTVKDAGDLGASLVTGSLGTKSADETVTGKLAVAGDGVTYTVQNNVATAYGLFSLDSAGNYTYTLTKALDSGATQGANTVPGAEKIGYTAQDSNGNVVKGTITVDVIDDVATANPNTNTVGEGATITVVAGSGVLVNDVAGADGYALGGGVVGLGKGSDTTTAVTGNIGTDFAGTYGTLKLNADGSYTYKSTANAVTGNATDEFVYTIQDKDGDLSTTTLKIDVTDVTLKADNQTVQVDEAALDMTKTGADLGFGAVTGSTGTTSPAETATGTLAMAGSGVKYVAQTNVATTYGLFSLDTNGNYTYTLTKPLDSGATQGANLVKGAETISYTATDANGNSVQGSVTVNVFDDVPTAKADTGTVSEGSTLLIPASGVLANDVGGADGLVGGVIGVGKGSDTTKAVSGNVGTALAGTYGTLTLNADGGYTYKADADKITANAVDEFVYTVKDADGDLSTTTLKITVNDVTLKADNQTVQVDEAALDTTKTGSDLGFGTVTGSTGTTSAAETVTGKLAVAGSGVTYDAQTLTTTYGLFELKADGSYTYTLTKPVTTTPAANDGAVAPTNGFETFAYTAKDAGGNSVGGSIKVNIVDDVAKANPDTGSVTEGSTLTVAANGVLGNDTAGADGYAAGGTIVGVGTGSDTTKAVSGSVGTEITGTYGKLTLNADGSYTYKSTANAVSGAATDSFVYTIKDGDGDLSTTTLKIDIKDVSLAADNRTETVYEAALDTTKTGSDLGFGTVTGSTGTTSAAETVTGKLAVTGTGITYTPQTQTTTYGLFDLKADGSYTYTLTKPFTTSPTANDGAVSPSGAFETFAYTAKDATGNTVGGSIKVNIVDDVPSLGTIQNGTANNNPASAVSTGTLHFLAGADGAGVPTISLTTTGVTSGGKALVTNQVGDTLTAYADVNADGKYGAGDTAVFTVKVNPGTDQYTFDLIAPLDGSIVNTPIGGTTSFGSGPAPYQVVSATDVNVDPLAIISGWAATKAFDATKWYNGTDALPAGLTYQDVNGSNAGWGVNNNNFTAGEFIRWDFGTPLDDFDGAGGYTPPATALPQISYATFDLIGYSGSDAIQFVVHYTDGTTSNATITGAALGSPVTLSAPTGKFIDWIDTYTANAGSGKIDITSVGVQSSVINKDLTFSVTIPDGDGDLASGSFKINIADKNAPSTAVPPLVLDLDHDGVEYLAKSAGVAFDYDHDGKLDPTAWVGADDGLLAIDLDGDGKVTQGSEFVFGGNGLTDLEGLAARYDSNHDGVLDAADADFAKFGVWQDANSNGVNDAGEFRTLTELGITAIGLKSDGVTQAAADGDVTVHGTATYTRADGTTGTLADASFATESEKLAARSAEIATVAAAAGALLAATSVAAQPAPEPTATDLPVAVEQTAPAVQQEDVAPASSPAATADLLGAAPAPEAPAAAHTTSMSGEGDRAPASLGAGSDDHAAALPTGDAGDASHAVAASAGPALFGGNDGGAEMMSMLLAVGHAPQPAAPAEVGAAVVQEALAQAEGTQFVDHLVANLGNGLGAGDGPAATGGAGSETALSAILAAQVSPGHDMALAPIDAGHSVEDALALAAAA